tara:strand:- start:74 stop:361 length:288 start_codon:yes stop_codon:yes gene_type:complete
MNLDQPATRIDFVMLQEDVNTNYNHFTELIRRQNEKINELVQKVIALEERPIVAATLTQGGLPYDIASNITRNRGAQSRIRRKTRKNTWRKSRKK